MSTEREKVLEIQQAHFNNRFDSRGFGSGPMEDELIAFRQQLALKHFRGIKGPVLDIACGRGEVVDALVWADVNAIGIDYADKWLEQNREIIPKGTFLRSLAQELPFASASIHGVSAFEIFEHIPESDSILMASEIFRVLAPGGTLLLSTPNAANIGSVIRKITNHTREDHVNEVPWYKLNKIFRDAGFEDIEIHGIGLITGMWLMQNNIPSHAVHKANILSADRFPQIATESLLIARKPLK